MRRMGRLIALVLIGITLILASGGCSAGSAPALGASPRWIGQQGGLFTVTPETARRVEQVANMLGGAIEAPVSLDIRVLKQSAPQAFAWGNGEIYVTTGLLDQMTDAELVAVVAHEIGHLLEGGQMHAVWSVAGRSAAHPEIEFAADAHALTLLQRVNIPKNSLRTALSKVLQFQPTGTPAHDELARRINILP